MERLTIDDMEIYKIARHIGHATRDLGSLCASPKVNIWNKFRPFQLAQEASPTELQRKNENWGYDIKSYRSVTTLMNDLRDLGKNKTLWKNRVPTSHFRMHDFIGYYQFAEPPMNWKMVNEGRTLYRTDNLIFTEGEVTREQELTIEDFPMFYNEQNKYKVGVLVRHHDFNDDRIQIHTTFKGNSVDFPGEPADYRIKANWLSFPGNGDYDVFFFLTPQTVTLEGNIDDHTIYPIPYAYTTFRYNNSTGLLIWGENIIKNKDGSESIEFTFRVRQQNYEVNTISNIEIYYLPISEYNNGTYWWQEGTDLQKAIIGTVSVRNFSTQVKFTLDGNLYQNTYTIAVQYSVNGYRYTEELAMDSPGDGGPEDERELPIT